MSHEDEILDLFEIVQLSFQNAQRQPDVARWKSCAQLAGVASVRVGAEGDIFRAAALEGVAEEARRQLNAMLAECAASDGLREAIAKMRKVAA